MAGPEVLTALQESTKAMTEVSVRLESLEGATDGKLVELKDHFNTRISRLDGQMGTMNAHLDNIAREASITNDLLRTDQEQRQAESEEQMLSL